MKIKYLPIRYTKRCYHSIDNQKCTGIEEEEFRYIYKGIDFRYPNITIECFKCRKQENEELKEEAHKIWEKEYK